MHVTSPIRCSPPFGGSTKPKRGAFERQRPGRAGGSPAKHASAPRNGVCQPSESAPPNVGTLVDGNVARAVAELPADAARDAKIAVPKLSGPARKTRVSGGA